MYTADAGSEGGAVLVEAYMEAAEERRASKALRADRKLAHAVATQWQGA